MTTDQRVTTALRMSTELRERLRTMAEADDRSMNSLICRILEQATNSAPAESELTTDQVRAIREAIETLARRWSETEDVASPFEEVMLVLPDALVDRQIRFLESYVSDGFELVRFADFVEPNSTYEVLRWDGTDGVFVSDVPSDLLGTNS